MGAHPIVEAIWGHFSSRMRFGEYVFIIRTPICHLWTVSSMRTALYDAERRRAEASLASKIAIRGVQDGARDRT